jgi:oligogalacturonide lyase
MATRGKGSRWVPEWSTYTDPVSGVKIRQLTHYKCLSNHLYFTESG